jgi:hypothetical protein
LISRTSKCSDNRPQSVARQKNTRGKRRQLGAQRTSRGRLKQRQVEARGVEEEQGPELEVHLRQLQELQDMWVLVDRADVA